MLLASENTGFFDPAHKPFIDFCGECIIDSDRHRAIQRRYLPARLWPAARCEAHGTLLPMSHAVEAKPFKYPVKPRGKYLRRGVEDIGDFRQLKPLPILRFFRIGNRIDIADASKYMVVFVLDQLVRD